MDGIVPYQPFYTVAGNLLAKAQDGESIDVATYKQVVLLALEHDPDVTICDYGRIIPPFQDYKTDFDDTIFDLLICFLRQKYPHHHRKNIPSVVCIGHVFRFAPRCIFEKFFKVYSENLAMFAGLILRGLERHSMVPSELCWRLQYACKMCLGPSRPIDDRYMYSFLHDTMWKGIDLEHPEYTEARSIYGFKYTFVQEFLLTNAEKYLALEQEDSESLKRLKLAVLSFNVHGVVRLLRTWSYSQAHLQHALDITLMAIDESIMDTSFFGQFVEYRQLMMKALYIDPWWDESMTQSVDGESDFCDTYKGSLEAHFTLGFHCIKKILELALKICDGKQHQSILSFTDDQEDCFEDMCKLQDKILRYWSNGDASQTDGRRSQPLHQAYIEALGRFLDLLGGCNCDEPCQNLNIKLTADDLHRWPGWANRLETDEMSECDRESCSSSKAAVSPPVVSCRSTYSIDQWRGMILVVCLVPSIAVNFLLLAQGYKL